MVRTTLIGILTGVFFSASLADASESARTPPDLAHAKTLAETVCAACHAADGNSPTPANPILAGQGADYLFKQLSEFKASADRPPVRTNAIMNGMVAGLSTEDMRGLAAYFSRQKMKPSAATDPKLVAVGRDLWRKGDFARGVPACAGCHGPTGAGIPAQFPRLGGQYAEYIEAQMKNFRGEERSNDPQRMMRDIADKLSDKQIKALADYVAGLR